MNAHPICHKRYPILLLSALCLLLSVLSACSPSMTAQQVKEIAQPLIEASLPLNDYLYGTGPELSDEYFGSYRRVSDGEAYTSLSELKEALSSVFTPEYCDRIDETVFGGHTGEEGRFYARYMDVEGSLYGLDGATVYIKVTRMYDYESIEVKKATDKRIVFSIDTTAGETSDRIEIKLLYDGASEGWRLDTPTY